MISMKIFFQIKHNNKNNINNLYDLKVLELIKLIEFSNKVKKFYLIMKLNNPGLFARGGSKVSKIKIKLIKGKPLINYTIEFALKNKNLVKFLYPQMIVKLLK